MRQTLVIFHYATIAIVVSYLVWRISYLRRVTLLHAVGLFYVLTTLLFYPLLEFNAYQILTEEVWRRAFVAGMLFCTGTIACDLLFYHRVESRGNQTERPSQVAQLIYISLFLFGMLGLARYYFQGGGYLHLGEISQVMRAGGAYYEGREAVAGTINAGVAHATASLYAIMPVVLAISIIRYRVERQMMYLLIGICSVVCSFLIAIVTLHRAHMLFALAFPVGIFLLLRNKKPLEPRLIGWLRWRWILSASIVLVLALGGGYMITDRSDVLESLNTAFDRVFVAPCLTSAFYYTAFPNHFGFRGFGKIFYMESTTSMSDVSTRDVAQYATVHYSMNADSGFIASAYTGAGVWGCLVVIVLYLGCVLLIDKLFEKESGNIRGINLLLNISGTAALAEVPLGVAMTVGGFALPSFCFYAYLKYCQRVQTPLVPGRRPHPAAPQSARHF